MSDVKQVIVIRNDLNMRKGKMVAQGAHASLGAVLRDSVGLSYANGDMGREIRMGKRGTRQYEAISAWLDRTFTKVCVQCDSEEQLLDLYTRAEMNENIHYYCLIEDSGRTEFGGVKTYTCLAIGPAFSEDIDPITGDLKLF